MLKQLPDFMIILSIQCLIWIISYNSFTTISYNIDIPGVTVFKLPLHRKTKGAKQF